METTPSSPVFIHSEASSSIDHGFQPTDPSSSSSVGADDADCVPLTTPSASSAPSSSTNPVAATRQRKRLCDHHHDGEEDISHDPPLFRSRISDPNPFTKDMGPAPSLREPHPPDLRRTHADDRPTLAEFRLAEGPKVRAQKLKAFWESLPDLPTLETTPTPTAMTKLPGQGTLSPLSSERAERLQRLYSEELVRRVRCERPEAKLWGGADDLNEPEAGSSGSGSLTTTGAGSSNSAGSSSAARKGKGIAWKDFRRFLWDQEKELWDIFHELDRDGDGKLDEAELANALKRNDIELTPSTLRDFVSLMSSGSPATTATTATTDGSKLKDKTYVTFSEFRDFLIMLPRKASMTEIYKFYQVKKRYPDGRGAARVNMEGDLNVSFPKTLTTSPPSPHKRHTVTTEDGERVVVDDETHNVVDGHDDENVQDEEEEYEDMDISGVNVAWKFLLAGGIAGIVSRTATAPFDRLKIYLITHVDTPSELRNPMHLVKGDVTAVAKESLKIGKLGFQHLGDAVRTIYVQGGGIRAFWVGNGLNVTKIFPESAIKFFSYEYSKRFFAQYWDDVQDQSDISGTSRFVSGGIGGITSQLTIYPVETLKTQLQSSTGPVRGRSALIETVKHMWQVGGVRSYYRGLTLGLVGVFPYSAIDMSTFEALKLAYLKSTGLDEPPTWAVLSFGAMSGCIGATTVYPINLLRTRLQASGSSGHPQMYTGFWDVTQKTLAREGWLGLYKGLLPTLAKVAPAVSISYVVYEHSKRALGIY